MKLEKRTIGECQDEIEILKYIDINGNWIEYKEYYNDESEVDKGNYKFYRAFIDNVKFVKNTEGDIVKEGRGRTKAIILQKLEEYKKYVYENIETE